MRSRKESYLWFQKTKFPWDEWARHNKGCLSKMVRTKNHSALQENNKLKRKLLFYGHKDEIVKKLESSYTNINIAVFYEGDVDDVQYDTFQISEWLSSDINLSKYDVLAFTTSNPGLLKDAFSKIFYFQGHVLALRTELHWYRNPLVVISPPKSGTHLLLKLVENFGYKEGGILPVNPECGKWYSLDAVSVHTSAQEYFRRKNIRGDLYGGRLNAFNTCRGLVMYRHPRDVFRSALNYNFDPNNTIFGCYMNGFGRKEKLKALLEPKSIVGDLGEILNDMANWAFFPNIATLGFEEFVESGRPSADPVWQIQLLFHIEGDPEDILDRSHGKSDTFREGKVFAPDEDIDLEAGSIYDVTRYYMTQLGYTPDERSTDYFYKKRLQGISTKDYRPVDKPIKVMQTENYILWYLNKVFYARNRHYSETFCRVVSHVNSSFYMEDARLEVILLKVKLCERNTLSNRLTHRFLKFMSKRGILNKLVSRLAN